jgi:hypothetical protein
MNEIKNNIIRIGAISFIIFIYFGIKKTNEQEQIVNKEIDNNLIVTIGKVKNRGRYFTSYIYYYDKIKYKGSYDGDGESDSKIGRYFKVELSKKNPEFSRLIIYDEIKDSIKIANSGFRKKTLNEILDSK